MGRLAEVSHREIGGMNTTHEPARLTLTDEQDVAAVVPHLLGFHPSDSMVVIACRDRHIEFTARFDIGLCHDADLLHDAFGQLRQPKLHYLLVAFTADTEAAQDALAHVEILLGARRVMLSAYTDGERVWRRGSSGSHRLRQHRPDLDRLASDMGMQPLGSRDELAASIAGPPPERIEAVALACAEALRRWRKRPLAARVVRTRELVEAGLADAARLTEAESAELGCLIDDVEVRDTVWLGMRRSRADAYIALFRRVLTDTSGPLSAPALGLLGVAAWLAGRGPLTTACLERGLGIDPEYRLFELLEETICNAITPREYEDVLRRIEASPTGAAVHAVG